MCAHFYTQLSYDLRTSINAVFKSVDSLQDQINSLAVVILQQGYALDVLTTEKKAYCVIWGKNVVIL